eukprot:scaffold4961_cov114-Isochrysis_galbana.AAC.6
MRGGPPRRVTAAVSVMSPTGIPSGEMRKVWTHINETCGEQDGWDGTEKRADCVGTGLALAATHHLPHPHVQPCVDGDDCVGREGDRDDRV